MSLELEVHPAQASILKVLLFKTEARFSELNATNLTTDHFTFHLKRLVEVGLVEKTKRNTYQLTRSGKEFANRFDTEELVLERQAKVGVLVCGIRKGKSSLRYLVQQRLKQPYYGFYGFVSGKVTWGETLRETATRELKEETGLTGKLTLMGIEHKMDYSKEGRLLEDKFFFVFRASDLKGKLIRNFEGGKNQWLSEKEIFQQTNLFDDIPEILKILKQNSLLFLEAKYTVSSY